MDVPNASPGHILLIAQDVAVANGVCADLDAAGLRCTFARTCAHAREFIIRHGVDLILLDRTVLATAGDCWCELRGHQETRLVPILAFSQQAGASNIATQAKTFTALGPVPGRLQIHGIILDRIAQRVSYEGKEVYLACAPFRLLEYFLGHPGRVISRGELFASLWGQHGPVGRRIDVYVGSLRKLLRRRNGGTLIQTSVELVMFLLMNGRKAGDCRCAVSTAMKTPDMMLPPLGPRAISSNSTTRVDACK
jgi:DNA-binding response OmpR family regulator